MVNIYPQSSRRAGSEPAVTVLVHFLAARLVLGSSPEAGGRPGTT